MVKLTNNSKKNVTKADYSGYCIDLLDKIAEAAGFEYELEESPDGLVGAMSDDGSWDGVIKHIMDKVKIVIHIVDMYDKLKAFPCFHYKTKF